MAVHRYVTSLFLAAMVGAISLMAAAAPPQASVSVRVYDSNHKDYHNWDDNENRAWGQYLSDNHKPVHTYAKSKKSEQTQYWNWRHEHPEDKK